MLISPKKEDFLKTFHDCGIEEFKTVVIDGIVRTLVDTKDPEDLHLKSLFLKESKEEGFMVSSFLKKYKEQINLFQEKYNFQSLFLSPVVFNSFKELQFDLDDQHVCFALSKIATKGIPLEIYDEETQMTFFFKEDGSCEQNITQIQQ